MKLLGGVVSVSSQKQKGSTFSFLVPAIIQEDTAIPEQVSVISRDAVHATKPMILVAEDDDLNYLLVHKILEYSTLDRLRAKNGKEAVELCKVNGNISLVLMDIQMPVMNGMEATEQIHSFRPNLPIIATTAYAQTGDAQKFIDVGCNDYIAKPYDRDALLNLIHQHLAVGA
jgi:CheY-like chemotaxis protein